MNEELKENMLDLLCKQAIYGLNEQETKQLKQLEYDRQESDSIELTVASLGLIDLNTNESMPAHLQAKLLAKAKGHFGKQDSNKTDPAMLAVVPMREVVTHEAAKPWFGWLGWAAAATACVALAISLLSPRTQTDVALKPTPSPTQEEQLSPAQKRQRLIETSGQIVTAQWGKGNITELENVTGDVVWSEAKQNGYVRLNGLPKNDVSKETYQLWIVAENQDPKTPIDGGTFDVNSDGEVIIPIDVRLRTLGPKAFAVTIEKPGGVVVSKQKRVAALAPVKPNKV